MLSAVLLAGCGEKAAEKDAQEEMTKSAKTAGEEVTEPAGDLEENGEQGQLEDGVLRTVFLKNESGGKLFVELKNENPFFGNIPEEILDENGKKITEDDLNSGDVLLVYGNQIVLESYPGQYPGISRLVREETANQELAGKYQEMLHQFCPEPDTAQVPELSVDYRQPEALITAAVAKGSYEWTRETEDGQEETEHADSAHVLEWGENLTDLTLKEETDFTLLFTYSPQSVEVKCWPEAEIRTPGSEGDIPEGESVEVTAGDEGFMFHGRPGYVYQVIGSWDEGTVEYGFLG